MPFAQWPGMWQPTTSAAGGRIADGTVQTMSTRWPDPTTIRSPPTAGSTLTPRRRARRSPTAAAASAASHASWAASSPITTSWTSSPPLTTWSSTVSPATTSTTDGWNDPVPGDDVDLARRGRGARARSAASAERRRRRRRRRPARPRHDGDASSGATARTRRESRADPLTAPRDEPRVGLTPARGAPHSAASAAQGRGDDPSRPRPGGSTPPDPDRGPAWPYPARPPSPRTDLRRPAARVDRSARPRRASRGPDEGLRE